MHRQPFIPAHNSRHRLAALALYRALLKSASRLSLPKDLQTQNLRSPIHHVIRKRFVSDRSLTSLRLVYASLTTGYKFLALFLTAQNTESPEYSQIINRLRSRPARRTLPKTKTTPPPKPTQKPFLVNISDDDTPRYAPTYSLASRTRPLHLCSTADGQPFIRLKKPQPYGLSKMVGRRGRLFQKKILRVVQIDEEIKPEAMLEDQWDNLVAAQMRTEGVAMDKDDSPPGSRPLTNSFGWSVQLSRLWWEWQIEKTWQDWIARAEALHQFVEEQSPVRKGLTRDKTEKSRRNPTEERSQDHPNVGVHPSPPFPLLAAIRAQLGDAKIASNETDPFTGPRWTALVRSERARLLRWLAREYANSTGKPQKS